MVTTPSRQPGMALLVSLSLLLALTLIAVGAAQTTILELRMTRNGTDAALAFHAAEAALAAAERDIEAGIAPGVLAFQSYGGEAPWQTYAWPDSRSAYLVEVVAGIEDSEGVAIDVFRITARGRGPGGAGAWLQTTYGAASTPGADPALSGRLSWAVLQPPR